MRYSPEIEHEINLLTSKIEEDEALCTYYQPRWLAIQLLEGDLNILNGKHAPENSLLEALHSSQRRLIELSGDDPDILLPEQRYEFVQSLVNSAVKRAEDDPSTFSDKIDRIVANRHLGVPIFLAIMYLVFNIVQNVSAPFLDWIDGFFTIYLAGWINDLLTLLHAPDWLNSLLIDGVIAGVGGVLVFVPGLFTMYAMLSIMEQSGYMSRAAFVMDRFMSKIGLHGKSFIPMILGFGCNVPAIYATRTIEKRETRLLTGLLIPFMSCSARLPVYLIFGIAFFPDKANLVIFLLYLIGILVAAGIALLVSRLIFQGKSLSIMVLELPEYQVPVLKNMLTYSWQQTEEFIHRAGTLILGFSMVLWLVLNLPWGVTNPHDSYFGKFSSLIAPTLEPAGFGNWESSGALITGLVAKELVVSSLSQIYGISEDANLPQADTSFLEDLKSLGIGLGDATLEAGKSLLDALTPGFTLFPQDPEKENLGLSQALQKAFTPLSAASYLVFVLLYIPCVAAIGAQKQEFGTKWAALSVAITMVVPWILAVIVYQGGLLLGLG
ncbi:ferrous iron transport protein B [bacterium]|nr:ferrous iron transport protein B [bacterium]MCB2179397.1 ferrous iron transport protein B [bacterium]